MKLCIDARPLLGNMTGIATYVYHLVKNLSQVDREMIIKCFYSSLKGKKPGHFENNYKIEEYRYFIPNRLLNYLWSYPGLPKVEWLTGDADIIHATNYYYIPHTKKSRLVTTVHDLNFIKNSRLASGDIKNIISKRLGRFLEKSCFIITLSNAVKNDILMHYSGIDESRIRPVYVGLDPYYSNHEKNMDPIIGGDYILSVGSFIPRKNFKSLIDAFRQVSRSGLKGMKLVIAGPVPGKIKKSIKEYAGENTIIFDYISRESLINLYKYARLFVMPSFDEGFCIPIIEAQSMGIPVLISDIPVFHEIAGDSAVYFPPGDIQALADAMVWLIENEEGQKALARRGHENIKRYDWADTAKRHLEIYRECM